MLIYEVTIKIPARRYAELLEWMPGHIEEILELGGFKLGKIFEPIPIAQPPSASSHGLLVVHYHIEHRQLLENYLQNHLPAMRAKTVEKFGDDLQAERKILKELGSYTPRP